MDILERIKKYKIEEVALRKRTTPVENLYRSEFYDASTVSLSDSITDLDKTGVIAEFKKKSPSEGFINEAAKVHEIANGYMEAGASAMSVLTDEYFFGGSNEDLIKARFHNSGPLLRKDFTVDSYQIHEAKSIGADAILLIAAILSRSEIARFAEEARDLGLQVLLEVHGEEELEKYVTGIEVIGVNNRNLKDFSVDLHQSVRLFPLLPSEAVKISESGIKTPEEMNKLFEVGFRGFLIGTQFMRTPDPVKAFHAFMKEYKNIRDGSKN